MLREISQTFLDLDRQIAARREAHRSEIYEMEETRRLIGENFGKSALSAVRSVVSDFNATLEAGQPTVCEDGLEVEIERSMENPSVWEVCVYANLVYNGRVLDYNSDWFILEYELGFKTDVYKERFKRMLEAEFVRAGVPFGVSCFAF